MADRVATINITEANFFGTEEWEYADLEEELLVISVGKTLSDGTYTYTKREEHFVKQSIIAVVSMAPFLVVAVFVSMIHDSL